MRKAVIGLLAVLALVSTSCLFSMQGFTVMKGAINAGDSTKAQFTLHPTSTQKFREYQFVLVGTDNPTALSVKKATWGTNGAFGGPSNMPSSGNLASVLVTDGGCQSNGLAFGDMTGITWKGFFTSTEVANKGLPGKKVIVQVGLKAASDATDAIVGVTGVTGMWSDDGDGILNVADAFVCTGIASTSIWVNGPA
ncbi:MAG TPA: hypothetical protein VFT27_10925 [Actinomycetota bacterium]|nr:hypothetical protein [Actinomycetota bacterium]